MDASKIDLLGVVENTYDIISGLVEFGKGCEDHELLKRYDAILCSNVRYLEEADIEEIINNQYVREFDRDGLVSLRDKFLDIYPYEIKSSDFSDVNKYLSDTFAEGSIEYSNNLLETVSSVGGFCGDIILTAEKVIEEIPTDELKRKLDESNSDSSDLLWSMNCVFRGIPTSSIENQLDMNRFEILKLDGLGTAYPAEDFLRIDNGNLDLTGLGKNAVLYSYRDAHLESPIC